MCFSSWKFHWTFWFHLSNSFHIVLCVVKLTQKIPTTMRQCSKINLFTGKHTKYNDLLENSRILHILQIISSFLKWEVGKMAGLIHFILIVTVWMSLMFALGIYLCLNLSHLILTLSHINSLTDNEWIPTGKSDSMVVGRVERRE